MSKFGPDKEKPRLYPCGRNTIRCRFEIGVNSACKVGQDTPRVKKYFDPNGRATPYFSRSLFLALVSGELILNCLPPVRIAGPTEASVYSATAGRDRASFTRLQSEIKQKKRPPSLSSLRAPRSEGSLLWAGFSAQGGAVFENIPLNLVFGLTRRVNIRSKQDVLHFFSILKSTATQIENQASWLN